MSMSNVCPTAVSGAASAVACSIPEPSMSTWWMGLATRRKIAWAGAAMCRVTVTRLGDAGSVMRWRTIPGVSVTDSLQVAGGAALLLATLYDVFQSVVLPRPAVGRVRLSLTLLVRGWTVWRWVNSRWRRLQTREGALAAYGPVAVATLLVLWGLMFIVGYALIYHGSIDQLHPQPDGFGSTLFYSTGRMLAFSVHGTEPSGGPLRVITSLEAATGFGLFALVINMLFSLFSAFSRREGPVVALDALAGAPPSGLQILENSAKLDLTGDLDRVFLAWQSWTVDVLESHLAYPVLFYFRSSHDNEAYVNSLGAVMDAAALVITTLDGVPKGAAHLMLKVGVHFTEDVRLFFRAPPLSHGGVERHEFVEACERLQRAGYTLRDLDVAWHDFSEIRRQYGPWLNRVSFRLFLPPAPWIGDRSYLPHRGAPRQRAPHRAD